MYYYGEEGGNFSSYYELGHDFGLTFIGKFKISFNYNESKDNFQGYIGPSGPATMDIFYGSKKDDKFGCKKCV